MTPQEVEALERNNTRLGIRVLNLEAQHQKLQEEYNSALQTLMCLIEESGGRAEIHDVTITRFSGDTTLHVHRDEANASYVYRITHGTNTTRTSREIRGETPSTEMG